MKLPEYARFEICDIIDTHKRIKLMDPECFITVVPDELTDEIIKYIESIEVDDGKVE